MQVHRHIGVVFALFCLGLFCWHLTTPDNPQHDVALVSMSVWAGLFLASAMFSVRVARVIQPVTLLVSAFLTVYFGNFPVAAIIVSIATLIFWAYGGFRQLNMVKSASTFSVVFLMYFLGIVMSGYGYGPAYAMAFVWTMLATGGFWIVWQVFVIFAADLLAQNRDLNKANKRLLGIINERK